MLWIGVDESVLQFLPMSSNSAQALKEGWANTSTGHNKQLDSSQVYLYRP